MQALLHLSQPESLTWGACGTSLGDCCGDLCLLAELTELFVLWALNKRPTSRGFKKLSGFLRWFCLRLEAQQQGRMFLFFNGNWS